MVIDTMVIAYALLGVSEHRDESLRVLRRVDEILVPASVWPELLSVAWKWVKAAEVSPATALAALRDGQALVNESVSVCDLWETAFGLSVERGHSPYDTLFVALAVQQGVRVITYDRRMLDRFPDHTLHPASFLAA